MRRFVLVLRALSIVAFGLSKAAGAQTFDFDYTHASLVSKAVNSGDFDERTITALRALPQTSAITRKLLLKDSDANLDYLRTLNASPAKKLAAGLVAAELARADGGKFAQVGAEVARQLKQYVPPDFNARVTVHFIFGTDSGGFTLDGAPNDVYVNLAMFTQASALELSEMVAHEVFHAVQANVMLPSPQPAAGTAVATTGPAWLKLQLYYLEQEGTAELFTHAMANRPATAYSATRKAGIERNRARMWGIASMFESLGFRLYTVPPANEVAYDRIYGLMFNTDFDETGYDLGWLMASTIEKKDGKAALFAMLKREPKHFLLRYQTLALADGNLPSFSDAFIKVVDAL